MCRADLLLLDEPTNHLDLDAVMWLEDWLKDFAGAVILITHDREFLDAMAEGIVHVENQRLNEYAGNYTAFETQRAARLALPAVGLREAAERPSRTWRRSSRASAPRPPRRARRKAASRRWRSSSASRPRTSIRRSRSRFAPPAEKPRQLFGLEDAAVGYPGRRSCRHRLERAARRRHRPPRPERRGQVDAAEVDRRQPAAHRGRVASRAQGLRVGYFAQHQVDQLRVERVGALAHGRLAPASASRSCATSSAASTSAATR
jgi:ATP-binding cassette subfamily F protein 3